MSVNLTKPVSLVKRPRAGEDWVSRHLDLSRIDYVKTVGRHALPYDRGNEWYNNAACNRTRAVSATDVLECPSCSPETYPAQHAYQTV